MHELLAIAAILFCIAFAVFIVKVPEIRWRLANPPEKIEAERKALEARIRNPDWLFYERHLERPAPTSLKELFADHSLLERGSFDFEVDGETIDVAGFMPIDEKGLEEAKKYLGLEIVPFADCDGDAYFLKPGRDEPNAVYQADFHQTGFFVEVAADLNHFVQRLRESSKKSEP